MRSSNEILFGTAPNFPTGNSTGSASANSLAVLSEQWIRASFQVDCNVGALNGTFTVQGSNDIAVGANPNQFNPTFWNTLGSVTCSMASGTSVWIPFNGPQGTINYFETCAKYHRIQFTAGNSGNTAGSFSVRAEIRAL
jgi:hypothetical protein